MVTSCLERMDRKTYSFYLSKALDALGFSYECIKHRQESWKLCSEHLTADEDENVTDLIAGSKAEGVSRMLEGDYDLMVSLNNFICYGSKDDMAVKNQRENDEQEEKTVILYQRTNTEHQTKQESDVCDKVCVNEFKSNIELLNKADESIRGIDYHPKANRTDVASEKFNETDTQELCTEFTSKDENDEQYDGVFLMDTENVSQGYTILQVLHLNDGKLYSKQIQEQSAIADAKTERDGSFVLSSSIFSALAYKCDEDEYTESVAGPAGRSVANKDHGIICDTDSVFCIPCVCKQINKSWSERKRRSGWPERKLIEEISSLDGHVVPVGFKGSETNDIEWRICYTLSEIKLIQSFNETQIKLHAIIKIVGKKLLQTKCPDITSYILKNVLLWMAEKIPTKHFIIENLYGLLMVALKFLRHTIRERNLLNYMIPKRNLYFGKLPENERKEVLNVLDNVIDSRDIFIETHKELAFLSKYIHIAVNDPDLIQYMETNKLKLEVLFRQNWREIWEDRVFNFLPLCLEQCSCLKCIVTLCEMVNASTKVKHLVIERVFWWLTGRFDDEIGKSENEDYIRSGDAYWMWDENGDIQSIDYDRKLNAEELDAFFNENK